MKDLQEFLTTQAQGDLLPWSVHVLAAQQFDHTYRQVEEAALELGILPMRYLRNRQSISTSQQLTLLRSSVAVIGCGGLGGYVVEELARLGVGRLTIVDPDSFVEHNLNRQLFSTHTSLGSPKVELAAERVGEINPSITTLPVKEYFNATNGISLLSDVSLVVDALDNIPDRLLLADICRELAIPLIHGTIAGWYGQVATQFPGEETIHKVYGNCVHDVGIEATLGNPSFTPAVVASIEVAEACKILLGKGTTLRGKMLHIDLLNMEIEIITLDA